MAAVNNHQYGPGYGLLALFKLFSPLVQSLELTIQPEEHLCFFLLSSNVDTAETQHHGRKK